MKRMFMLVLLIPCLILAQEQQSANFRITKSVIDAGGAASTSEDFGLYSAFGQPTPVGPQTSEDFALSAGYLAPMFAISPLSPIQALVVLGGQPNVLLMWDPISGANSYKIYRDTIATFTPGPTTYLDMTADTSYDDVTALGLPPIRHFYMVTASSELPPTSARAAAAQRKADLERQNLPGKARR